MLKFNDNNIFVGYIKQLLHSFNLPTAKVIKNDKKYYEGGLYIKHNNIYEYNCILTKDGFAEEPTFNYIRPYIYNKQILNYTKTLKLNSLIYDSHTHEYLGEYLRFIKDYHGLNLMSLYNCFSNKIVDSLHVKFSVGDKEISIETSNNYKIYSLPVKLGEKYTIAIDSNMPVEMFCGFTGKGYYSVDGIESNTYIKYKTMQFNKPVVYDKLSDLYDEGYLKEEDNLRLFIKLPFNNDSSIVILEGIYLGMNDKLHKIVHYDEVIPGQPSYGADPFALSYNHSIINFETDDFENIPLVSQKQLLQLNTHESYPFADRLVEYLVGNVITDLDPISDNVKRIQTILFKRHNTDEDPKIGINSINYYGIWDPKYKALLYEIAKEMNIMDKNDLLGYVDKDVEKVLGATPDIYKEE